MSATAMRLFVPITKVDVEKRTVYGVATAELPDRANEICDYASSKPYFQAWSAEVEKSSGGKSKGNLRAMHSKIAAGKLTAINFDDENKQIEVAAKIVDDDEWLKVTEGVYTGFSQGGRYVRRWPDEETGLVRFTAEPNEISLVDLPCLAEATFQIVKAAGVVEEKHFKAPVEKTNDELRAEALAKLDERSAEADTKTVAKEQAVPDPTSLASLAPENGDGAFGNDHAGRDAALPQTDAIEARAKLYADAEGVSVNDGHRAHAQATMVAESPAMAPNREAETVVAASDTPAQGENGAIKTVESEIEEDQPEQVWILRGETFPTKKAALRWKRDQDVAASVRALTAPIDDSLDAIAEKLGIERREFSPSERKSDAKTISDVPDTRKAALSDAADAITKWAGEEVCDAARALTALNMVFDLFMGEVMEEEYNASQTSSLRGAIQNLKDFIASEIQEDNFPDEMVAQSAKADDAQGDDAITKDTITKDTITKGDAAAEPVVDHLDAAISSLERLRDGSANLEKRGSRNNSADQERLQKAHDLIKDLGAACMAESSGKAAGSDDLDKSEGVEVKLRNAALEERISEYGKALAAVQSKLEQVLSRPEPAKAALLAVGKAADTVTGSEKTLSVEDAQKALAAMSPEKRAETLMKMALSNPVSIPV